MLGLLSGVSLVGRLPQAHDLGGNMMSNTLVRHAIRRRSPIAVTK